MVITGHRERDRGFESGFLQGRVICEPDSNYHVPGRMEDRWMAARRRLLRKAAKQGAPTSAIEALSNNLNRRSRRTVSARSNPEI
jgi:hypothetical protein